MNNKRTSYLDWSLDNSIQIADKEKNVIILRYSSSSKPIYHHFLLLWMESKAARYYSLLQVVSTLLQDVWLRQEYGRHYYSVGETPLHPQIAGNRNPDKSATEAMGGCSGA